jgi:hypothetical protein
LKNPWHRDDESFETDLSSDWILLSTEFYVFANSYTARETTPKGLHLADEYAELARGGMRRFGHLIEVPDSFLEWVREQPRFQLHQFKVIGEFGDGGCGCCAEEKAESAKCR